MITSATNTGWEGDVPVAQSGKTGLPAPSVIRTAKIATIEPSRVVRVAGRIDRKTARTVADRLIKAVG